MKNFKTLLYASLFLLASTTASISQITYSMKPDYCRGIDARVITIAGLTAPGNTNYGSFEYIQAATWTFSDIGGGTGVIRSYIEFIDVRNIPQGATISSATLYLYGPTSDPWAPLGNYGTNECWVQRVTSSWGEFSVTGNSQPSVTTSNQVSLPTVSTSYGNVALNVTALVQDMVNLPPSQRYGFAIRLKSETTYRWISFASSDYPDATKHPKLDVTFSICESGLQSEDKETHQRIDFPADKISLEEADRFKNNSFPLTVFPNPVQDIISVNFELPGLGDAKVSIISQTNGQELKSIFIDGTTRKQHLTIPLDRALKSESIVILRVDQAGATASQKIVIAK